MLAGVENGSARGGIGYPRGVTIALIVDAGPLYAYVDADDALRMVELFAQYHDLALGSVDASVVAAAERLGIAEITTVDRRRFSVVRPRHAAAFDIRP